MAAFDRHERAFERYESSFARVETNLDRQEARALTCRVFIREMDRRSVIQDLLRRGDESMAKQSKHSDQLLAEIKDAREGITGAPSTTRPHRPAAASARCLSAIFTTPARTRPIRSARLRCCHRGAGR
jgi:hypothetical protein